MWHIRKLYIIYASVECSVLLNNGYRKHQDGGDSKEVREHPSVHLQQLA